MRPLCVLLCLLLALMPALAADPRNGGNHGGENEQSFSLTLVLAGVIVLGLVALAIFGERTDSSREEVVVSSREDPDITGRPVEDDADDEDRDPVRDADLFRGLEDD